MAEPRIVDGAVATSNGQLVRLPLRIVQLVQIGDALVVRGEGEPEHGYVSGNIWGLSLDGAILWQVTKSPPLDSQFVDIEQRGNKLVAFNFNGYRCNVNPLDGAIEALIFTK